MEREAVGRTPGNFLSYLSNDSIFFVPQEESELLNTAGLVRCDSPNTRPVLHVNKEQGSCGSSSFF